MSCENDAVFPLGSLVLVKRGRHTGSVCVVVGFEKTSRGDRIMLADGRRFKVGRPKRKNVRHIDATGEVVIEVAQRLERGDSLDDGWLCEILSRGGR